MLVSAAKYFIRNPGRDYILSDPYDRLPIYLLYKIPPSQEIIQADRSPGFLFSCKDLSLQYPNFPPSSERPNY